MKRFFKDTVIGFLNLWLSIGFGLLIVYFVGQMLVFNFLENFYTDPAEWNRIRMISMTVGFLLVSFIYLGLLARRRGYRAGTFSLKTELPPLVGMCVIQLGLGAAFRGHMVLSGAAYFPAWLIANGGFPLEGERVSLGTTVLFMLLFDCLYIGVILLMTWLGARSRRADRQEIIPGAGNGHF